MKNTIYNFVKNDFNYEIKNNQKKIFLSPKLKPYLSNYKSNLEEFKKNKNKMVSNGIEKTVLSYFIYFCEYCLELLTFKTQIEVLTKLSTDYKYNDCQFDFYIQEIVLKLINDE